MNVRLNRIIHFFGEKTTNFLRGRQNQGGDAQGKRFFSVRFRHLRDSKAKKIC